MDTRFAHLNPDKRRRKMGNESGENGDDQNNGAAASFTEAVTPLSDKQMDFQLKMAEMKLKTIEAEVLLAQTKSDAASRVRDDASEAESQSSPMGLRHYAKLLAGTFPKFPTDGEVPIWFESAESALEAYEVPRELWGQIVFPMIAERVAYLSTRLTPAQHRDYDVLKGVVLDELKLSAAEYQRRFLAATRRRTETWRSFATRLKSYLNFYVEARKVSSYEQLLDLLVADQIKTGLTEEAARYVKLREGENWFKASELAPLLQTFEEAAGEGSACRRAGSSDKAELEGGRQKAGRDVKQGKGKPPTHGKTPPYRQGGCFRCGNWRHSIDRCPYADGEASDKGDKGKDPPAGERLAARVSADAFTPARSQLHAVKVSCKDKVFDAIVDTGAEITVLREGSVPDELVTPYGTIDLVSAFGERVKAKLVVVPLAVLGEQSLIQEIDDATPVMCALTDKLTHTDCLISADTWGKLQTPLGEVGSAARIEAVQTRAQRVASEGESLTESQPSVPTPDVQPLSQKRGGNENSRIAADGQSASGANSDAHKFRIEQLHDESLRGAWKNAERGKAGMHIVDEMLYHKDKVLGQSVRQLVLPLSRRSAVLRLAHESYWGGHLGFRKTKARIKYSFFWPNMESDIRDYCSRCHGCQVRSDRRQAERVPITPLTRPRLPFQKVNIDVIGPIDPPSARGHRYALCIIDLCTRWPEVVCLRSLTAKATCEALLSVFSRTGIPEVVCSDCGTNFTAALTSEFLAKLGCSPRFSTPDHPESNGSVERWNRVFKNMLYHVIEKDARNWDRFVPFLLWAYREVPHDTTGVSPFRMRCMAGTQWGRLRYSRVVGQGRPKSQLS